MKSIKSAVSSPMIFVKKCCSMKNIILKNVVLACLIAAQLIVPMAAQAQTNTAKKLSPEKIELAHKMFLLQSSEQLKRYKKMNLEQIKSDMFRNMEGVEVKIKELAGNDGKVLAQWEDKRAEFAANLNSIQDKETLLLQYQAAIEESQNAYFLTGLCLYYSTGENPLLSEPDGKSSAWRCAFMALYETPILPISILAFLYWMLGGK